MEDTHGGASYQLKGLDEFVLILIIMEDTHGALNTSSIMSTFKVLILIIMEDTHGDASCPCIFYQFAVLILIIMEDTHGANLWKVLSKEGLNPYYNGRYSWSIQQHFYIFI